MKEKIEVQIGISLFKLHENFPSLMLCPAVAKPTQKS